MFGTVLDLDTETTLQFLANDRIVLKANCNIYYWVIIAKQLDMYVMYFADWQTGLVDWARYSF